MRSLLFAAVAATVLALPANAADLYVSPSGSGTACTQASPCSTIGQAITTAAPGDTIHVLTGSYVLGSTISVGKSLSIVGEGRPALSQSFSGRMFNVAANNVTISGFKMTGANRTRTGESCGGTEAVRAGAVSGLKLLDNVVGTMTCGFVLIGTSQFTIQNNYLASIKYGTIVLNGASGGLIDRNTLVDVNHDGPLGQNAYGIAASLNGTISSTNVIISKNYVRNAPAWECYDTHDGQSIHFFDNVCWRYGRVGINSANSGVRELTDVRHERNFIHGGGLTNQWNSIVHTGFGNIVNNTIRNWNNTANCGFHAPSATVSGNSCSLGSADILPPSIPTGLVAMAQSSSEIDLAWAAAVDDVAATAYEVFRNGTLLTTVTGVSHRDTGLASGVNYTYEVRARDAAGNVSVARSLPVSATTGGEPPPPPPDDTTPPSTPDGVTAMATSSSSILVEWLPSTDDVGVTGYEVQRGGVVRGNVTATEFEDTGLAPATRYTYRVRARDAAGNWSELSSTAEATTDAAPPPPEEDITPPIVSIVSPADGATVRRKTTVIVEFTVTEPDSPVTATLVEDVGHNGICTVTGPGEHTCAWRVPTAPGTRRLLLTATSEGGTTSATATVAVVK